MKMISALVMKYLLPVLAALASIAGIWFAGKSVGKSKAKAERSEEKQAEVKAAAQKEIDTVKGASDVKNDVNKLDNGAALNELRDDWKR